MLVLDAYLKQVGKNFDGIGSLFDDIDFGIASQSADNAYLIIYIVLRCTYLVIGKACV